MSNSRSTTPTPNRPGPTTRTTADSGDTPTTQLPSDETNKARHLIEEENTYLPMRSFTHDPDPQSPIHRGVTRSAVGDLMEPTTKRLRTSAIESPTQATGPESPSSDSQGGMADSEGDGTTGRSEDVASNAGSQPKKKRTRTLTTPHQAAVLHALLEKSRFPTTAVREEVGRSIGLSARKVQIWFQNQRQKARKNSQNRANAAKSQPPQYGPYPPAASPTASTSAYPSMGPSRGHEGFNFHHSSSRAFGAQESTPEGLPHQPAPLTESTTDDAAPPRLLGPGMPGGLLYPRHPFRTRDEEWPASAPPMQQQFPLSTGPSRYHSPPPTDAPSMHRPLTSHPRPRFEGDPSRTLPPLVRTRPSTTSSLAMRRPHHWDVTSPLGPHPAHGSAELERSISPEVRFAHQVPDHPGYSPPILPPPFALQPVPQWEESADAILSRPSSSWSHPDARSPDKPGSSPPPSTLSTLPDASEPPVGGRASSSLRHEFGGGEMSRIQPPSPAPQVHSPAPSRPGRYDPVREIFVPFSRPLTPASRSSSKNRDEEGTLESSEAQS